MTRSNVKSIFACIYLFDNKNCNYFFRNLSIKCLIFKIRYAKQKLNLTDFYQTFHNGKLKSLGYPIDKAEIMDFVHFSIQYKKRY